MAAPADAEVLYRLAITGFQALVAALILAASPRSWAHRGFALLFGLNGVQSLAIEAPGAGQLLQASFLDTFTALLLAYLMAQYPVPLRSARARLAVRAAVAGGAAAWVVLFVITSGAPRSLAPAWNELLHTGPLVAAGLLLFLRGVPGYLALDRGPLQTQTFLVAGAFGLHLLRLGAAGLQELVVAPPAPSPSVGGLLGLAGLALAGAHAVARLLARAWADPRARPRHLALAALLAAGPGLFLLGRALQRATGAGADLGEVSVYVVRPLLVAYAMVRFDLFTLPPAAQRVLVAATAGSFLVMAYLMAFRVLSEAPAPLGGERALTGLAALLLVAGLAGAATILRQRLGLAGRSADPDRIEAYRLALERARLEEPSQARDARLEGIRRSLRIAPEEHDLLQVLLERHVFVPAGSVAAAQPGQVLAGRYEVVRELGRGGFGRALLARDRAAGHGGLVVVKELLWPWMEEGHGRAALRNEANAARDLEHPNVARVLALLEDGPQLRLVRDYVPGRTLEELVAERGPQPPAEAARVVGEALAGLAALHARGILHLDLKPGNVVLDERGRAVLIDFGSAARGPGAGPAGEPGAPGPTRAAATRSAPRAGTLGFMAPEQVRGEPPDARTDVFAAGALLHHLLTGRSHLGPASGAFAQEEAIVRGKPPGLPPACPASIRAAVHRALQRDPARRFPSAQAMAEALAGQPARRGRAT